MKVFAIFLLLLISIGASNIQAFDDNDSHPRLTEKAIENSVLNDYISKNLGLSNGVETELQSSEGTYSILEWLKKGSKDEDSPNCRASNHFHNPLLPWDQSYMTDEPWYISTWCGLTGYSTKYSNVTWATGYLSPAPDGSKIAISNQQMGWDNARNYYLQALTALNSTDRETYFAKTFQALGQVLHLLEDMAVPAHVRNDFRSHLAFQGVQLSWPNRWFGNSFEYYVKNNPGLVSGASDIPSFTKVTDYWDTDGSAIGLAEFTNANYFSDSTIPNNSPTVEHTFPNPQISNTSHQICEDYEPGATIMRKYISRGSGSSCPQAGSGTVDHFATPSLLNEESIITNDNISTLKLWLDDNVHDTYAKELLPEAIGYSAGLLNYFFRGQINMEKDPDNPGQYIIKNESSERMEGTFTLYYDDTNDNRREVANWSLSINANDKSGPVSFTAPTFPEPKEYGEYMLVFNGKRGNEEGAVVGREITEQTNYGRVVSVSNYYGSRGNITVSTKNGTIMGKLPSTGLSDVRAVRFDIDDWNTFVVMAVYSDWGDPNHGCPNGCYEFHKYSIDENALTLNYQGVVLQEGPISTNELSEEIIYEKPYQDDYGTNFHRIWYVQENRHSLDYVDFFLKDGNIKSFGVISEESYSYLYERLFETDGGGRGGFINHRKSSKLYYDGVVQEKTPYNCTGGYYYFTEDGYPEVVTCQPQEPQDPYFVPLAVFNSSDYTYALYQYQFTGYFAGRPQYSSYLTNVASTLPIVMPQDLKNNTYLKTMLREDDKYSFYNNYPSKYLKSYSSEIGVADCSGFLITDTQVGDGYLGWQSSGKVVSFENCSDWQPLGRTGSSGSNDYKFDVILNYQP